MSTLQALEHFCVSLRHSRWLRDAEPLWGRLRKPYTAILDTLAPHGLERVINGTDPLRVRSGLRAIGSSYEPEVWKHVMGAVRAGDVIVDVGAHVGLYSIAFAKRVGPAGRVHAFEPDPANFAMLREQTRINGVAERIRLHPVAVSDTDGTVGFASNGSESRIVGAHDARTVSSVCLDSVFADEAVDVMKIDVEGFEETVLRGATTLLGDVKRAPRLVCIEVHPYAWPAVGTTGQSLITLLNGHGYAVQDLSGNDVRCIDRYGEIVALKPESYRR